MSETHRGNGTALTPGCIGASIIRGNKMALQFAQLVALENLRRNELKHRLLSGLQMQAFRKSLSAVIDELFQHGTAKETFNAMNIATLKRLAEKWEGVIDIAIEPEPRHRRYVARFDVHFRKSRSK